MSIEFSNVDDFKPIDSFDADLGDGRFITVRYGGTSNREYESAIRAFALKHRRALQNNQVALEKTDRVEMLAFARHVVIGWRGFKNGTGTDIPFTPEACFSLFQQYPAIFFQLQEEAKTLANFRDDDIEAGKETVGN